MGVAFCLLPSQLLAGTYDTRAIGNGCLCTLTFVYGRLPKESGLKIRYSYFCNVHKRARFFERYT